MAGLLPSQGLLGRAKINGCSGGFAAAASIYLSSGPPGDVDAWSRTTVVVPAYQERSRLPRLLTALRPLPFARLVLVDDGSTDGTWGAAVPLLRAGDVALRLADNRGKAVALWEGLRHVETPWVVFLDADLDGVTREHVEALCRPVWSARCHMSVAVLAEAHPWLRAFRYWGGILSGQRCLPTALARRALSCLRDWGYGLEIGLTRFARRAGWSVRYVLWPGVRHHSKFLKHGPVRGLLIYLWSFVQFAWASWRDFEER